MFDKELLTYRVNLQAQKRAATFEIGYKESFLSEHDRGEEITELYLHRWHSIVVRLILLLIDEYFSQKNQLFFLCKEDPFYMLLKRKFKALQM